MSLFSEYDVPVEELFAAAADVERHAGDVENLDGAVDGAHRQAVVGVAGLLEGPMRDATVAAKVAAVSVMQGSVVAGAAVRRWAMHVSCYNVRIAEVNAEWDAAAADDFGASIDLERGMVPEDQAAAIAAFHDEKDAKRAALLWDLTARQQRYDADLEAAAAEVARLLDPGAATEDLLVDLYDGGALAEGMAPAFPGIDYVSGANPVARWWNLVASRVVPEAFWEMSADQISAYLLDGANADEVGDIVPALALLLGLSPLLPQERTFLEALGRYDGRLVAEAVQAATPGRDSLAVIGRHTDRLREINARLAVGGTLTAGERRYMHGWYDTVGAGGLAALPGHVERAIHSDVLGVAEADQEEHLARLRGRYLGPVADGVMNLSNPDAGGMDRVHAMPDAIRRLLDTRVGTTTPNGQWTFDVERDRESLVWGDIVIPGLERYAGFADLMDASTVEGGDRFTFALGEHAIHVKQDLMALTARGDIDAVVDSHALPDGDAMFEFPPERAGELVGLLHRGDRAVSTMLSVVARNADASAGVLVDGDLRPVLLAAEWDDATGAAELIASGATHDPSDPGTRTQAEAALAVLRDVGRNRLAYLDQMSPDVASAVVELAALNMDAFARPPAADADGSRVAADLHAVAGRSYLGLDLTADDRQAILQFVAGTGSDDGAEHDARTFAAAAELYEQSLLARAFERRDGATLSQALAWTGRLNGERTNAVYGYWAHEHDTARAEYEVERQRAESAALAARVTTRLALESTSLIPGSSGFKPALTLLSAVGKGGYGTVLEDAILPEEPSDEQLRAAGAHDDDLRRVSSVARNYLFVAAAGHAGVDPFDYTGGDASVLAGVEHLYERDAGGRPMLREFDELLTNRPGGNASNNQDRLTWARTYAGGAWLEQVRARQPGADVTIAEDFDRLYDDFAGPRQGRQPYPTGGDEEHAWQRDYRAEGGRLWSDEDDVRRMIYGDGRHFPIDDPRNLGRNLERLAGLE